MLFRSMARFPSRDASRSQTSGKRLQVFEAAEKSGEDSERELSASSCSRECGSLPKVLKCHVTPTIQMLSQQLKQHQGHGGLQGCCNLGKWRGTTKLNQVLTIRRTWQDQTKTNQGNIRSGPGGGEEKPEQKRKPRSTRRSAALLEVRLGDACINESLGGKDLRLIATCTYPELQPTKSEINHYARPGHHRRDSQGLEPGFARFGAV